MGQIRDLEGEFGGVENCGAVLSSFNDHSGWTIKGGDIAKEKGVDHTVKRGTWTI